MPKINIYELEEEDSKPQVRKVKMNSKKIKKMRNNG